MSFLTGLIKAIKPLVPDSVVNRVVRDYFNHHYQSFGKLLAVSVDAVRREVILELDLKGETQPLLVTIEDYEITTVGDETFIEIKKVTTSREWLNLLAAEFIKDRKFPVPELIKGVL